MHSEPNGRASASAHDPVRLVEDTGDVQARQAVEALGTVVARAFRRAPFDVPERNAGQFGHVGQIA